jgi:hypothetical protein
VNSFFILPSFKSVMGLIILFPPNIPAGAEGPVLCLPLPVVFLKYPYIIADEIRMATGIISRLPSLLPP